MDLGAAGQKATQVRPDGDPPLQGEGIRDFAPYPK
jgi:hypothetical protein